MPTLLEALNFLGKNANVANTLAASASAFSAVLALLLSLISIFVSYFALQLQRRHNILSVKPFPEITVADFEDSLRVKLRNHGSGPLVIKSLKARSVEKTRNTLIECMPELQDRTWTNFAGVIDGRSLLPGDEIVLVELTEYGDETDFNISRDIARGALSLQTIHIKYTDTYGSRFEPYVKSLDWFGRHLEKN